MPLYRECTRPLTFENICHRTFFDIPFFFLSHFLWSGGPQRARIVTVTSRPPQPWDGPQTLAVFEAKLEAQRHARELNLIGMHVRTDTNHPMYYFDQSHLLPHRPDAFCGGDPSSLMSALGIISIISK